MAKAKKTWCVCASSLVDAVGRTYAPGDGITASSCRLYALADTREQAERIKADLDGSRRMQESRMPGDGKMWPELEVCEYDPLDFVGRQNRDEYTGKRYAALCGRLAEEATKNAAGLN